MSVIELRTPAEIEEMRPAGRFVASVLEATSKAAAVGVNLLELDALAHDMIRAAGAESCYIDYHPSFGASPFGKVICTSVNDAVLHGLPHDYRLRDGDLLSLDFAASVERLGRGLGDLDRGRHAARRGPAAHRHHAACPRRRHRRRPPRQPHRRHLARPSPTSRRPTGYSINTDFGGHGVGRTMHGDPHIPNNGRPGRGLPLKPGLVIAIEPWFLETTDRIFTDPDGWTLRSADGSRGAHSEHTIAVTDGDPIVLTQRG